MALILCIETSSKNCSVSIYNNKSIVACKEELDENYCHGQKLHVLIEKLLLESKMSINQLDVFCFSSGPGSYTGLRIGAATVKGFAFALDKPIIAVSTLKSLVWGILNDMLKKEKNEYSFFCPIMDSRKGEVYAAMYNHNLVEYIKPFPCDIVNFSFSEYLEKGKICFFGPGKYKLQKVIKHKNACFIDNYIPSSKYLGVLANIHFNQNNFVDVAYFEPLYLKPFIPTVSKKRIF